MAKTKSEADTASQAGNKNELSGGVGGGELEQPELVNQAGNENELPGGAGAGDELEQPELVNQAGNENELPGGAGAGDELEQPELTNQTKSDDDDAAGAVIVEARALLAFEFDGVLIFAGSLVRAWRSQIDAMGGKVDTDSAAVEYVRQANARLIDLTEL